MGPFFIHSLSLAAQSPSLRYTVSWIGNDYSGKTQWVQQDVGGLFVDGDGTVFTNVFWEEGGNNASQYDGAGRFVRSARHTHGWGYEGGDSVAANARYVFIVQRVDNEDGHLVGNSWPPRGLNWSGISRRSRADMTQGASFEGGVGKSSEGQVVEGSFLPVVTMPKEAKGDIRGLWATDTRLYVSSPFDNTVKVYDVETMKPVAIWPVARPDRLCVDRSGRVWIMQRPEKPEGAWRALSYDAEGVLLPSSFTLAPGIVPAALCVDRQNRLLVADDGIDQQIKIYAPLDAAPSLTGTLGLREGVWAPPQPGLFGDLRFTHPTGIGADRNGNLYVASGGRPPYSSGTALECDDADGKRVWRHLGLTFVDCGAIDPGSETDLYTKDKHFTLDDAKSPGADWSYTGYTVNPWKYPDDPRLHSLATDVWVRRIGERKFLFASDMTGEMLRLYRFDSATDGETAIPCGMVCPKHLGGDYPPGQPGAGEWIWCDANANGSIERNEYQVSGGGEASSPFVPDEEGALWNVTPKGIRRLSLAEIDARGVPRYDFAKATVWPSPADLDAVRRIHYDATSDTLFLAGNKGGERNQHWKPMGPVLCAYDHWTKGGTLRWKIVLPYEAGAEWHFSHEPISFDVAGDYLFVAYTRGLAAEKLTEAFVKVYRTSDGAFVGNLTAEKDLGETGLLDLIESVRAFRRANGEYVILLEEDAKAKMILFRWQP